MKRLTGEQQALVEAHLHCARIAAAGIRACTLTYAERLSAAYCALCEVAMEYDGTRGKFAPFAIQAIRWRLWRELRRRALQLQYTDWDHLKEIARDPRDFAAPVELADEVAAVRGRFGLLSAVERRWLEAFLATGNWAEAARRLKMRRGSERNAVRRVRGKLCHQGVNF